MQIYGNKITFELTDDELNIIECLLLERVADMSNRLGTIDDRKYLQILQLKAKIDGINRIYKYETKKELKVKENRDHLANIGLMNELCKAAVEAE
jgi:hypothetical protein